LALATAHSLQLRSVETGEVLWERLHEADPPAAFARARGGIVCLHASRVRACATGDGEPLWEHAPPGGGLQAQWLCDRRHVVVQQLKPDRTIVLDARDGTLVAETPGFPEPWFAPPVRVDDDRFALVAPRRRPQVLSIADAGQTCEYSGPISFANASPVIVGCHIAPCVIVDGDTIGQFNAKSGKPRWSTPLSRQPIAGADRLVCHDERQLYVAADDVVRALSLADGSTAWQQVLPASSERWRTLVCGESIIVHQERSPSSSDVQVIVFDRQSGQRVQQLTFPSAQGGEPVRFDQDSQLPLFCVGSRVVGLGQFPLLEAEADADLPRGTQR
jgi:hypothetical protein